MLLLAGCQLPEAQGLRPITGEITLGNVAIAGATAHESERVTGYKQGDSGQMFIDSDLLVDAARKGDLMMTAVEIKNVESRFARIIDTWEGIYRARFALRQGLILAYAVDVRDGSGTVKVRRRSNDFQEAQDNEAVFAVLLKQSHFGGMTLTQDQEILRYRFGDLFANLEGEDAELFYSLRAIGRAVHKGREVIVAKASGAVYLDGNPMDVDGIVYLDERTGASLYADTQLIHRNGEGTKSRLRIVYSLTLD